MYCSVCREPFDTIDVLTEEIHSLKGLLEGGKKRELQLHDRLDSLIQQQYEFIREKERMELERQEQQYFFRKELEDMKIWMQRELSFGQKYSQLQEKMYSQPTFQSSFRPMESYRAAEVPFASSSIQAKFMEEDSKQKKLEEELTKLKQQLQDVLNAKNTVQSSAQVAPTQSTPSFAIVRPQEVVKPATVSVPDPLTLESLEHKRDSQQVLDTESNDMKKFKSNNPKLQILKSHQQKHTPVEEAKDEGEPMEEEREEEVPKSKPMLQVKIPSPRILVSQPSPTTITKLVDENEEPQDASKEESKKDEQDSMLQDLDEKEIEFSSPSTSVPASPSTLNVPTSPSFGGPSGSTLSPSSPTSLRRSPPPRRRPMMMQIMSTK